MSEATLGGDMRRISNSELATWNTCQRKYYYEFDLSLEPKVTGGALGRGVLLHESLAHYYEARKQGLSHSDSVLAGKKVLNDALRSDNVFAHETVMEVMTLVTGYWNYYQGDPDWEILEVEKGYDLPIEDGVYEYSLRLDLLVRLRSTGDVVLVDHKTCYDFWKQDDLALNPQFPKYIGTLRANGIRVDYALLNQIRTRKLKAPTGDDLYRRTECRPSRAKVGAALREQIIGSRQIIAHRSLPVEAREQNVLRVLNKQICNWCNVKDLCTAEFDGGDITSAIVLDYKQRTYGYNDPTTEDM